MFTTIEKLQGKVTRSYGAVIQFGEKVFVTDIFLQRWLHSRNLRVR